MLALLVKDMARPFELKRFLRQTPKYLLEQYFAARELTLEIDFGSLETSSVEPLAEAVRALVDAERQKVDADFRDIDAIASERGYRAMMDEADWHIRNNPTKYGHDRDLRQRLAIMENDHERAMWVFVNRPAYWRGTLRFFQADNLGPSFWQKRKNLPRADVKVDNASIGALAEALGRYFHVVHGRGRLCEVEPLRRGELDYFYCFGEAFSEAPHAWVGAQARPASEETSARGYFHLLEKGWQPRHLLEGWQARGAGSRDDSSAGIILGAKELRQNEADERVYDLDVLKERDFAFQFGPDSEIEEVLVRSMRLSYRYGQKPYFIIMGDYKSNANSIHDELARLAQGVPLDALHITQVELGVRFAPTAAKQMRLVLARLTHPNRCSLRYDGLDLVVRRMLANSAIEPRDP